MALTKIRAQNIKLKGKLSGLHPTPPGKKTRFLIRWADAGDGGRVLREHTVLTRALSSSLQIRRGEHFLSN